MGEPPPEELAAARERLIREVETEIRLTSHYHGSEHLDPAVVAALRAVPRERFVPPTLRGQAYGNHPLPIGLGQTISQPYIVAIMSHLIAIKPGAKVYELGTGSGYQAAVLAEMGADVYTVEIVPELAERAAATLAELGYAKVRVRAGDGYLGWPEAGPFDAIIVTAAGPEVPPVSGRAAQSRRAPRDAPGGDGRYPATGRGHQGWPTAPCTAGTSCRYASSPSPEAPVRR